MCNFQLTKMYDDFPTAEELFDEFDIHPYFPFGDNRKESQWWKASFDGHLFGYTAYLTGNSEDEVFKQMSKLNHFRDWHISMHGRVRGVIQGICKICGKQDKDYILHTHQEEEITDEAWFDIIKNVWKTNRSFTFERIRSDRIDFENTEKVYEYMYLKKNIVVETQKPLS